MAAARSVLWLWLWLELYAFRGRRRRDPGPVVGFLPVTAAARGCACSVCDHERAAA